jgi:hypothetical protein
MISDQLDEESLHLALLARTDVRHTADIRLSGEFIACRKIGKVRWPSVLLWETAVSVSPIGLMISGK